VPEEVSGATVVSQNPQNPDRMQSTDCLGECIIASEFNRLASKLVVWKTVLLALSIFLITVCSLHAEVAQGSQVNSAHQLISSTYQDIGNPTRPGSVGYDSVKDVYTISGGGAGITGTSDQFYFVASSQGDVGELIVKVNSISGLDPDAKAGLMFRESTVAGPIHVFLFQREDGRVQMRCRHSADGDTSESVRVGATGSEKWLKLSRDGNLFTGYWSNDGEDWTVLDQITLTMALPCEAGMAVTAENDRLCTAV